MPKQRAKIFEFAIVHHPKNKRDAEGNDVTEKSKIVVELTTVLAADENEALIQASRTIPDEYVDQLETLDIAIRPFG